MDTPRSNMMCPISSLVIRYTLLIPTIFSRMSKEYKEENLVQFFQESLVEQKETFLKACSKLYSQLLNHPFPIDYNLFNEET